jgi:hypothetical protein
MPPDVTDSRALTRFSSSVSQRDMRAQPMATGKPCPRVSIPHTPSGVAVHSRPVASIRQVSSGEVIAGLSNRIPLRIQARRSFPGQNGSGKHARFSRLAPVSSSNTDPSSSKDQGMNSRNQFPKYFIGIETEFLVQDPKKKEFPLADRHGERRRNRFRQFLTNLASLHNQNVPEQYPRMETEFEDDDWWPGQEDYAHWILTDEDDLLPFLPKINQCKFLFVDVPFGLFDDSDCSCICWRETSPSVDLQLTRNVLIAACRGR